MSGPLEGIRILDLSSVLLGPYASQLLGDYGADVIKIEGPEGDSTRYTGPARNRGMAAMFLGSNRNKRSLVLDLKQPSARDALLRMVEGADVFMHSIRPQKMQKLGLGAEQVLARNPRIVYAGLHGFREDGPYGGKPAYDDIIQGLSGSVALMQMQSGEPRYLPTVMADKTCGIAAANAITAALLARERTGRGQSIEIPMFETMVSFNMIEHYYGQHFVPPLAPSGYPRTLTEWRRPCKTLDGYISMMPYTTEHWRRFFQEIGQPELAQDERFADMAARTRNIAALYEIMGRHIAQRSSADWLAACERLEIPAGPINQLADLEHDEHLKHIGFFKEIDHPSEGKLRVPDIPVRFNGTPTAIKPHPRLGEHSSEILREFGMSEETIADMLRTGATAGDA
jgi:crotonobetainyl-CoA:carnitine CoA-transferase CaiB-like acyl-CoA transferase